MEHLVHLKDMRINELKGNSNTQQQPHPQSFVAQQGMPLQQPIKSNLPPQHFIPNPHPPQPIMHNPPPRQLINHQGKQGNPNFSGPHFATHTNPAMKFPSHPPLPEIPRTPPR